MKTIQHIALVILLFPLTLTAAPLDTAKAIRQANISYEIVDLASGTTVNSYNPQQCAIPASITKLITTATAIDLLGGNFRFETQLQTNGEIQASQLTGDLIIKGGCDPTLGSNQMGDPSFISRMADAIQQKGIRHIRGSIRSDASIIAPFPVPLGWVMEDIPYYYGAGAYGLSAFDNAITITFQSGEPGSRPTIVNVSPRQPNITIDNQLQTLLIGKDSIMPISMPYSDQLILHGGIPAHRDNYHVRFSATNPPLQVAMLLHNELNKRGITIDGQPTVQNSSLPDEKRTTLQTFHSPRLRDVAQLTNFKSNNQYAEHIFRFLGTAAQPYNATSKCAAVLVSNHWKKQGVNVDDLYLIDGCGLAPLNTFSASTLNGILVTMAKSDHFIDFYNSIPVAGKEGTVAGFLRKTPLEGKARIKSGSMTHVQCYSGYITGPSGKQYAFTIMANNYGCSRREIRKIIESWLVRDAK